ncbi:unnamed protein product [Polarella glacialis]|uniref:Glutamine amidotransferase domain-containing protein n=1 Tax=Polarella glacialis TaxID=89957 RepID=A0A813M2Y8_POLGL|nr:unnamed protein product [Polarella glacialis]
MEEQERRTDVVLVINNNPDGGPGRYTPFLIERIREAGLLVQEARTVDAVDAYAESVSRDGGHAKVGLIITCGSPVVLTEPVDVRAHVAKTTAAVLHFPNAPIVGICFGMQLLAVLYGGKLEEQRETRHAGLWAELQLRCEQPSRLLDGLTTAFHQWASNFIFVTQIPSQFIATAVDSSERVMAMEHVHEHVYGVQWHPEVLHEEVGRHIIDRMVALVGQPRSPTGPRGRRGQSNLVPSVSPFIQPFSSRRPSSVELTGSLVAPPEASKSSKSSNTSYPEVVSWHQVDLELRKVVQGLMAGVSRAAAADLGRLLAGARKDTLARLRDGSSVSGRPLLPKDSPCPGPSPGVSDAALAAAAEALREAARTWAANPAPAG